MAAPDPNRFTNTMNPGQGNVRVGGGVSAASVNQTVEWGSADQAYIGEKRDSSGKLYSTLMPLKEAKLGYMFLNASERKRLNDTMDAWYGKGRWAPSWIPKLYGRAVDASAYQYAYSQQKITPIDAFELIAAQSAQSGELGTKGGGGGGGYGTAVSTQVNLTDPSTARKVVDDALTQYLGRRANPRETEKFMSALAGQERMNPSKSVTTRSPGGTSKVQSGGFNPSTFAEEWARGQEGSGEFQAATTYLDAFINSLKSVV